MIESPVEFGAGGADDERTLRGNAAAYAGCGCPTPADVTRAHVACAAPL